MSTENEEKPSVLIDPKSIEAMQADDTGGVPQIKVFLKSGSTIALTFASKSMRDQAMRSFSNLLMGHIVL